MGFKSYDTFNVFCIKTDKVSNSPLLFWYISHFRGSNNYSLFSRNYGQSKLIYRYFSFHRAKGIWGCDNLTRIFHLIRWGLIFHLRQILVCYNQPFMFYSNFEWRAPPPGFGSSPARVNARSTHPPKSALTLSFIASCLT